MLPLELKVLRIVSDNGLIEKCQHVIVAVSGGPDSMALLHVLAACAPSLGCSLVTVYVDHNLRPQEAAKEAALVQAAASVLEVPCCIVSVAVSEHARAHKQSVEEAARYLRYRGLREIAGRYADSVIAVGHTADDQAEEVLLRLLKGAGRKGLSGMAYRNNDVIRPLLEIDKQELLRYLQLKNRSYCQDSSNFDRRFLRNRIRHDLIPYLEKEFDSGVRSALVKTASNLADDEILLEELTTRVREKLVVVQREGEEFRTAFLDRRLFGEQPNSLQRRLLERLLWEIGSSASYVHIQQVRRAALEGKSGTELHLKEGLRVGIYKDRLEFSYPRGRRAWRGGLHCRPK